MFEDLIAAIEWLRNHQSTVNYNKTDQLSLLGWSKLSSALWFLQSKAERYLKGAELS